MDSRQYVAVAGPPLGCTQVAHEEVWREASESRSCSGRGPCPRHLTIETPLDVPIRVAPLAIIRSAASQSRTPPDAFTPMASPTTMRIRAIASALAPPAG